MLTNLLLYRLAIVNMLGLALAFWAHTQGFVLPVFVSDVSYLSYAIVALFAAGLVSTFVRAAKVSAAINDVKGRGWATAYITRKANKMHSKNSHVSAIAGWLQVLGLLGTVIGVAISINGVEGDNTDVILAGFRTAVGTTILGGFLSLWTSANAQMLDTATSGLIGDLEDVV